MTGHELFKKINEMLDKEGYTFNITINLKKK